MRRNSHIAGGAGEWRPGNVARAQAQCESIVAFQHRGGNAQAGNVKPADHVMRFRHDGAGAATWTNAAEPEIRPRAFHCQASYFSNSAALTQTLRAPDQSRAAGQQEDRAQPLSHRLRGSPPQIGSRQHQHTAEQGRGRQVTCGLRQCLGCSVAAAAGGLDAGAGLAWAISTGGCSRCAPARSGQVLCRLRLGRRSWSWGSCRRPGLE